MRFAHTNIAARDWRRLADFYIKVFACREKPPLRRLSGKWLDKATGLRHADLEGIHLLLPGHGDNGPTLEIFSYADALAGKEIMANHIGLTHIAFEVEDVETTLSIALNEGGKRLGVVINKKVAGIGALCLVYFRDPEGNIVELQSWDTR
jgi:catechol 2,3-dioxygenase-like lactoylglutathione lyase family enzyme